MTKQRVVITGMGVISAIGNDVNSFWESIQNSVCGIDNITLFDTTYSPVKLAAEIKELHSEPYFENREVKHNARFMMLARIAAQQAYRSSQLDKADIDRDRFGVYVSSSIGGIEVLENSRELSTSSSLSRVSPYLIPNTLVNLASGAIAIDVQARGSNLAVVTACASGANSIGEAFRSIQFGFEDVILAGASDAAITPLSIGGFASMRAMHTGDNPDRACIPFDRERSGMVMGEGAGVVILESLSHAMKRNAPILAEVLGYGTNCDAFSIVSPDLEGRSISKAIHRALESSGIDKKRIQYINAHGTATVLNDKTEARAIKDVFAEHAKNVLVSSTKSMTGHTLGASGAIEAIVCIKALQSSFVPATINYQIPDSECDLNLVLNRGITQEMDIVMSNSFGFGGHNTCLIFKKWQP
jgi:3-oxoacyl-[acyl-carrier-protein] synthase II